MKRFLLFAGYAYYPSGGWNDFHSSYDTQEEASQKILSLIQHETSLEWFHIIDLETGQKV